MAAVQVAVGKDGGNSGEVRVGSGLGRVGGLLVSIWVEATVRPLSPSVQIFEWKATITISFNGHCCTSDMNTPSWLLYI